MNVDENKVNIHKLIIETPLNTIVEESTTEKLVNVNVLYCRAGYQRVLCRRALNAPDVTLQLATRSWSTHWNSCSENASPVGQLRSVVMSKSSRSPADRLQR